MDKYDLVIIGAGAAGCSAAIYATRYNLKTLLLGGSMPGGLITEALEVENYPGYLSISGQKLSKLFLDQATALGSDYKAEIVTDIISRDNYFETKTHDYNYMSSSVILAMGTKHKKLGVKGEDEYRGFGVSYCSTCDGPFFKNKTVAVIGGGNSAVEGASDLSVHASQVYLIYRSDLKAAPLYIDNARNKRNVEEIPGVNVTEILGKKTVNEIVLDKEIGGTNRLSVDGVFIQIGYAPENILAEQLGVDISGYGYVKVDAGMGTSIKGVFCAGDLNDSSNFLHQQVTSAAEGAIAAQSVFRYIRGMDYLIKQN